MFTTKLDELLAEREELLLRGCNDEKLNDKINQLLKTWRTNTLVENGMFTIHK